MIFRGKSFFSLVVISLLILNPISVFAQSSSQPAVCNAAPEEFTQLVSLARELINSIKTIGTQGDYLGKPVNPNWFQGTTFVPPSQNVFKKVGTAATKALSTATAITAIFTSPQQGAGLTDFFAGIIVLFKNKVFARDLQTVEDVDALLTQKRYELGLGGGWYATINEQNVKVIQKILDAYVAKGILKNASISSSTKYNGVTTTVGALLAGLKSFLSSSVQDDLMGRLGTSNISFTISPTALTTMSEQYAQARGVKNLCDPAYKNFVNNMKRIGSGSADQVKSSLRMFSDAAKRLADVFSKNPDPANKQRQQQLLQSYYGNALVRSGNSFSDIIHTRVDNGGAFSARRSAGLETQGAETTQVEQQKTALPTPKVSRTTFDQIILAGVAQVFSGQDRDLPQANLADVKDFSSYFDTLGRKIVDILKILGSKDIDGSLIKDLGTACEMQCGSVSKKCW